MDRSGSSGRRLHLCGVDDFAAAAGKDAAQQDRRGKAGRQRPQRQAAGPRLPVRAAVETILNVRKLCGRRIEQYDVRGGIQPEILHLQRIGDGFTRRQCAAVGRFIDRNIGEYGCDRQQPVLDLAVRSGADGGGVLHAGRGDERVGRQPQPQERLARRKVGAGRHGEAQQDGLYAGALGTMTEAAASSAEKRPSRSKSIQP